jgi:hypothetical protein
MATLNSFKPANIRTWAVSADKLTLFYTQSGSNAGVFAAPLP